MRSRIAVPVAAACAALLALASTPSQAQAQAPAREKFTFALNWFAVGDHAAYWVALDKGYYAQRGLDVTIENSKGSGDSIAKVDTGRADAGLADAVPIISAVGRGARVKMIGMVFDKTPMTFFSRADAPLSKPSDLEGKTVGAPAGDSQRLAFPAFARLNKIDANKVTWVNIEPTAKVASIAEKRMDGVADYTTGLPFYDKAMGEGKVARLAWADYGFDLYAMSIMAGEKTMTERPQQLKAFLEASYMGWRDVMANPKEALAIYKKRVPEIDVAIIEANLLLGFELMRTKAYADNGIGYIDEKKMCGSVDIVNTYMGLPKKVDCKAVYTTSYFTKVAMPLAVK
ncbi:ABC transporter, substrate-binding protein, aliphatic sulfonates family [Variovorax sp. PBL-H6]|uniref:ABC transporter substrate-binding protein n=1 Tax=Variovorax sp. PBL-H6 TaxID=434009 RepID=UPI0013189029|nr:ABC transporter substrate-binding protein [Variovorax sp. PBL-H6]VTU37136.1 ABC transporter, substrate-binding protein, aliphatic sulfonates family [Variovorax sp. PBL-H6]